MLSRQTVGQKVYVHWLERLRIRGVARNVPRQMDPAPCQHTILSVMGKLDPSPGTSRLRPRARPM